MQKTYFIADLHLTENRPHLTQLFRQFMLEQAPQAEKLYILCGLTILPTYQVIDLYGVPTLLCHGDTLCVDEVKYQQYRKKVHQKWRQWLFLHLPLKVRLKIAEKIRAKSRQDKQYKPTEIMDVNADFVLQIFHKFNVTQMIHGHTHRQKRHEIPPHFTRIVLGDWGETSSILEVSPNAIQFINDNLRRENG